MDAVGMDTTGAASAAPGPVPDTTAPTLSGAITLSGVTQNGAHASWPAATDDNAVVGYKISCDTGVPTWIDVGNVTNWDIAGKAPGSTYTVRVYAYDQAGNQSGEISAQLQTAAEVTPDQLAPVLTGPIELSAITSRGARAVWPAASDNVAVAGYDFSCDTGAPFWVDIGNVLGYDITAKDPSSTYTVRVRSYDEAGNKSVAITAQLVTSAAEPVQQDQGALDSYGRVLPHGDDPMIVPQIKPITEEQAASGDYLKDRYALYGLRIAIESPRGSVRHWKAADGTKGSHVMSFAYGYIEGTLGNDGDELDCTIGPAPLNAELAYVVNQFIDGVFDEHKIMFGFANQNEAEAGYLSGYEDGWQGMRDCVPCTLMQLKWWIANGNKALPIAQKQLPDEGTNKMEKVLWDSANMPLHSNLEQVLYSLRAHDSADGLLFDSLTVQDIIADADGVLTFDALVLPFARLQQRMTLLQKVLDRASGTVKVAAMQVSEPFTQRGSTNVAVVYELTDGQTVSVFFHNPDTTPKKIAPGDELVSWKWMLNKKDITVAVAPERGRDLDVRTVATRIMKLAEKNSERFAKANTNRAAKLQVIADLKTELETKEATLADLTRQIEVARVERENDPAPIPDPVTPEPDVQPDPAPVDPAPAPSLNVDGIKAVVTSADPMPGVTVGANWVIMNASRPLLGTETMSNGEFLDGRYYAAIDPADDMAEAYLSENVKNSASVVFVADKEALNTMALNTVSPDSVGAYLEMDPEERDIALRGFVLRLNNKTYGELKELAAKGMPEVPQPDPQPTVPDDVRRQVESALARLREIASGVEAAKSLETKFGSPGRYQADALANRMGDIDAAKKTLAMFREHAPKNGIDAEAFITSLGGEPDLSPSPEALAWMESEAADRAAAEKAAAEAAAQAQRDAEAAAAAEKTAKEAQEAQESADGDFLALAAAGDVDFYDKAVTDRLAALAQKYTDPDGAYLDMIQRAKVAAKNFFIAEFQKKVA